MVAVTVFDAANVWAAKLFIRMSATVPVEDVSVNVAADWISPIPEVVHAAADAPIGARVTRPLTVVVWVAPDTAEPTVIAVVEPDSPAVPILIVLVLPDAVAPAWMSVVCDTVERPSVIVPVPLVPPT